MDIKNLVSERYSKKRKEFQNKDEHLILLDLIFEILEKENFPEKLRIYFEFPYYITNGKKVDTFSQNLKNSCSKALFYKFMGPKRKEENKDIYMEIEINKSNFKDLN